MPIPLPNLDDRSYADLTAEARALIPSLDPAWTNHNPSDPGITLVELLAWLTEMLLFQVNQVTPAGTGNFLRLLNGSDWARPDDVSLDAAIRQTIVRLRERHRAVTAADYEWLALNAWPQGDAAKKLPKLARVHCVPQRNLSIADPNKRREQVPAHVSLVVVPQTPPAPGAASDLLDTVWKFFDERRTLTTRHHVVEPGYVTVEISANLALHDGALPDKTLKRARQALADYYDPLRGGPQQQGWPFGRAVYASEASAVLEQVPLVDYVEDVKVTAPGAPARVQTDASGQAVTVVLEVDELVQPLATELVAYDVLGRRFPRP